MIPCPHFRKFVCWQPALPEIRVVVDRLGTGIRKWDSSCRVFSVGAQLIEVSKRYFEEIPGFAV